MPQFSILVPALNAGATLCETLDAVAAQTLPDWECIVVDDGSTDSTAELAGEYANRDCRFRVISQPNAGTAGAYNSGLAMSVGEFIVLCSADDLLLPAHLESMATTIAGAPSHDIYSCNGYVQLPDGGRQVRYMEAEWQQSRSLELEEVLDACFFSVGAVCRRLAVLSVGGFRAGVYGEDYDLWLRLMLTGSTHLYSPTASSVHRLSPGQKSAARERVLESDIAILTNLLTLLEAPDRRAASIEASIRARRERVAEYHAASIVEHQAQSLSHLLQLLLGSRVAEIALNVIHHVSGSVRPIRVRMAKRRARRGLGS